MVWHVVQSNPALATWKKRADLTDAARNAVLVATGFYTLSIAGLVYAFMVGDFQLEAADGTSEATLRAAVAKVLTADAEAITVTDFNEENQKTLGTALGFITTFLLVFAGIALFVGAFIIYNTFAMIVAQRTRELALLRAVGASRPQVRRVVLGEAFVVGLVGSLVGIGFGVLVAAGAKAALRSFVGIDLSSDLPVGPVTVAASLVVGTVVTMFGAWLPARRAAAISVRESLAYE